MVEEGKFVQIQYTGTFDNGEIFDSNVGLEPLEFQIGSGAIIAGLDRGIMGMKIDDEKNITIKPEHGYGDYNNDFVLTVPLAEMQSNFNPEPGMVLSIQMENGSLIPARITEVNGETVTLDLNHPLAGKTLHFAVKILAINDEAQLESGCGCCSDGSCSDDSCGNGRCSC
ncbi:MAG TPA: peptidylprolyl isomerase [Spirochaetota bacterium]|nr:peptidylprolyl isomerase [Spirochaetota bacterium]HPC39506.1 peptidylprolyl isomerase [Spirochaetota bacterium]HPL17556.1 peptidylprolyl isomerase [Spirochaetota bacterium]HQF06844.1 peptidylprolyl isomerase [Spirochaetota bacterium]HQH95537.1 peptidylprolyl isomerase [Spirochaetota bacterium]